MDRAKGAVWNGHLTGRLFGPARQSRSAGYIYGVHGAGVPNLPEIRILMVTQEEHAQALAAFFRGALPRRSPPACRGPIRSNVCRPFGRPELPRRQPPEALSGALKRCFRRVLFPRSRVRASARICCPYRRVEETGGCSFL